MPRGRRKFKVPLLGSPGVVETTPVEVETTPVEVETTPTHPPEGEHRMSVSSPNITEIKMELSDEEGSSKVTDKRKTRGGCRGRRAATVTVKKEKDVDTLTFVDESLSSTLDASSTGLDTLYIPPPIPTDDLDPEEGDLLEEDIKDELGVGMSRFPESVVGGILTIDMSSLHVSELFPETSAAEQNFLEEELNYTIPAEEENNFTIAEDPNEPPFSPAKKGRRKYTRGGGAAKRGRAPGVGGKGKRRAELSSPSGAGDVVPKVRKAPVKRGRKAKDAGQSSTDQNGSSSTTFVPSTTVNKPFEGRLYRSSDLDCFEPSEEMDPADLIGFEHIEIFRAADYLTGYAAGKINAGQIGGGGKGAKNVKISPTTAQGWASCQINTCEVADELMKEVVAELKRLDSAEVEETQKLDAEL